MISAYYLVSYIKTKGCTTKLIAGTIIDIHSVLLSQFTIIHYSFIHVLKINVLELLKLRNYGIHSQCIDR